MIINLGGHAVHVMRSVKSTEHLIYVAEMGFLLVADPDCPKDEIRVYQDGKLKHTQKINPETEVPRGD